MGINQGLSVAAMEYVWGNSDISGGWDILREIMRCKMDLPFYIALIERRQHRIIVCRICLCGISLIANQESITPLHFFVLHMEYPQQIKQPGLICRRLWEKMSVLQIW
ncbi:MAG: hypothetical protein V8T31_10795 [Lachnospiraceae bacterium]